LLGTIDLIEKPLTGIIALLDEEVRMPKGADKTFLEKVVAKYKGQAREFGKPSLPLSFPSRHDSYLICVLYLIDYDHRIPNEFIIRHYAEPVNYLVEGFLDKNRDTLSGDLVDQMKASQLQLVSILFSPNSTFSY
jgi:myosin heavy subunit